MEHLHWLLLIDGWQWPKSISRCSRIFIDQQIKLCLRPARWSWCRLVRSTKAMYKKRECTYEQKQPPEVFCVKRVHRNLTKLTGKHLCQSLFFNKVVNFVKFLRTPFFQNTSGRLLLYETKSIKDLKYFFCLKWICWNFHETCSNCFLTFL